MKTIIFAALVLSALLARAENSQTVNSSTLTFNSEAAEAAPQGLIPFLGFDGGYTGHNNDVPVEGTPTSLRLLGSYYFDLPYVADLGYGFSNQQFSNSSAQNTAKTGSSLEAAARYRFANNWQAGVIADQFFGMGRSYAASQGDAQFIGAQGLKEFAFAKSWLARVGGRVMTETNNTGHMVNMYMLDLQIGWNPKAVATSVKSANANTVAAPVVATTQPTTNTTASTQDVNFNSLKNGNSIFFAESSYKIGKKDEKNLSQLASVLKKNKDLFANVEVLGHADISGKDSLNQKLSAERAQNVKLALVKAGLNQDSIVAVGKGASTSREVLPQDRKVELIFTGVKDEAALEKALSTVR